MNDDPIPLGRCDGLSHKVCSNGKLSVSTVDDHEQLHPAGSAVVHQLGERSVDRATSEQDIVHEDDPASGHIEVDVGLPEHWLLKTCIEVITIQRDVHKAQQGSDAAPLLDQSSETVGQRRTASDNSDEGNACAQCIDDLICKPTKELLKLITRHRCRAAHLYLSDRGTSYRLDTRLGR